MRRKKSTGRKTGDREDRSDLRLLIVLGGAVALAAIGILAILYTSPA